MYYFDIYRNPRAQDIYIVFVKHVSPFIYCSCVTSHTNITLIWPQNMTKPQFQMGFRVVSKVTFIARHHPRWTQPLSLLRPGENSVTSQRDMTPYPVMTPTLVEQEACFGAVMGLVCSCVPIKKLKMIMREVGETYSKVRQWQYITGRIGGQRLVVMKEE